MKFVAVSYGTEGDTRPVATLCRALMDAGHSVCMLADVSTTAYAKSIGVPTRVLAGDIRTVIRVTPLHQVPKALIGLTLKHTSEWMDTISDEVKGCDAILVSGLTALVALSAAETVPGIKVIGSLMMTMSVTNDFPSPLFPYAQPWWLRWFRWYNIATHLFMNWITWLILRGATNKARIKHGLSPRGAVFYDYPVVYGVSPTILPRPSDYPADVIHTGQWVLPHNDWSPPPELVAFLAAGEKPVYVGFGSMAGFDESVLYAVVTALGHRRALFSKGWSTLDTSHLPSNILRIDPTPHDWLLPQCAMAIHHGGSGTTHSACAAGVPSIIIAMAGDQAFWARQMINLGIARSVLWGQKVTHEEIAAAVIFADRGAVQEKAKALGETMRNEDGVHVAVKMIEEVMGERSAR